VIIIYTTIEKLEQAECIAETLLAERLIACANIWPIHSMYVLNKKLMKSPEVAMYLKTSADHQDAVYNRLVELHPYECPAIMTINVDQAHLPFAKWIDVQTGI
jgi:periplasmic divalent cation tolerance protein